MHQNRKLFELATKNAQRNDADAFIAALPEDLKSTFASAERHYHPCLSGVFAPLIHRAIKLQKIGNQSKPGRCVVMTSSQAKAIAALRVGVETLPPGEYLVVPGGGNAVTVVGETTWVADLPGFVLQHTQFQQVVNLVVQGHINELAMASLDGHAALVLDVSSGFLADEPSPRERVYELTAWVDVTGEGRAL